MRHPIVELDAGDSETRAILAELHDLAVAGGLCHESVFHIRLDSARGELGGKRGRDLLEQGATLRSASVEQGCRPANLVRERLIAEPGEILEHHGHDHRVFQFKADRGAIVLGCEAKIDGRKDAQSRQAIGDLLQFVAVNRIARFQAGSRGNLDIAITMRAGSMHLGHDKRRRYGLRR